MREIRPATSADLGSLSEIEAAADRVFADFAGFDIGDDARSGEERAAQPGYLLVVSDAPGERPVGFAHVLEHPGGAHLEQLSVSPGSARRGHGRALVKAAISEAVRRGHGRVTLRTYADVPWNRPFYESCGFEVAPQPEETFFRALLAAELEAGLFEHGARVFMRADAVAVPRNGAAS
ncbi:GNAT family N-acetyltransferase [Leucobacter ruminantium]|uniref:GNAT family N-acetyltransferase n=1 Tax=Leucobacter ruminantium TaxID=1289170 RepID=A0A939M0Y7_9MICO|nr:GNAT family N-acetyltransferase [Leucobacter ruminantium]MBO1806578.1 GNAT family N-acetyltransferase [Leucobacter ruminantium]